MVEEESHQVSLEVALVAAHAISFFMQLGHDPILTAWICSCQVIKGCYGDSY